MTDKGRCNRLHFEDLNDAFAFVRAEAEAATWEASIRIVHEKLMGLGPGEIKEVADIERDLRARAAQARGGA